MVRLKSRQTDLEVYFEADMIDEVVEKAGYYETNSIAETIKSGYTKLKIKPSDINIKYMTREQYMKLIEITSSDGNFFDVECDDGISFSKCYHKNEISLKRSLDRQNNSYFYTGTLSLGVR